MRSYKLIVILIVVPATLFVVSCKKKKNDNPFGNSKIAAVTISHAGSVLHYRIVYDAYNNVDSMIITGDSASAGYHGLRKYTYFGSSYSITDENNNTFTVQANTAGLILKVLVPDTVSMIYNGSELGEMDVWMPLTVYPYHTTVHTNYTWQNGDIVRDSTGGPAYTFTYDNSKPGQPGDAWRIGQFINYGRSYIKTTHLPQAMMYGSAWIQKYFYTADASERVTQFTLVTNNKGVSPDDTTVYTYSY